MSKKMINVKEKYFDFCRSKKIQRKTYYQNITKEILELSESTLNKGISDYLNIIPMTPSESQGDNFLVIPFFIDNQLVTIRSP